MHIIIGMNFNIHLKGEIKFPKPAVKLQLTQNKHHEHHHPYHPPQRSLYSFSK